MQRIHDRCRRVHELRDELKRAMGAKDRPTIERVVKELEVRLRHHHLGPSELICFALI